MLGGDEPPEPDYYEILGVGPEASLEDVADGYRREMRRRHPDNNPLSPEAEERTKLIAQAGAILRDPARVLIVRGGKLNHQQCVSYEGRQKHPIQPAAHHKTGCAQARTRLTVEKTHSSQGASLNTRSPSIERGNQFAPCRSILAATRGTVLVM
jgi:DnaJ-class molecular chaperone